MAIAPISLMEQNIPFLCRNGEVEEINLISSFYNFQNQEEKYMENVAYIDLTSVVFILCFEWVWDSTCSRTDVK